MKDFNKLFEEYMMMDKKTLAQLLAMRDIRDSENKQQTINPAPWCPDPYTPYVPYPYQPIQPYYGDSVTITCMV